MRLDKDNKAWAILTEEEKTALSLQLGFDKSTWQAGEIMGKAHYKYLEIKARAEKYLKMFTEHFEVCEDLIPKGVKLDPRFEKFLRLVIEERLSIYQAIEGVEDNEFQLTTSRDKLIIDEFEKLKKRKEYTHQALINIILDFDRWNNFRILPKPLQEPSAFKRRNKNRLKKQIKTIVNIHPFVIEKVIEKFAIKKAGGNIAHLPLFTQKGKEYKMICIDYDKQETVDQINRLGLFIFKNKSKAEEFAKLIVSFDINKPKDCKQGLEFWPQYRVIIQGALNYNFVENIIPSRRYLENILNTWDLNYVRNLKKNKSQKD